MGLSGLAVCLVKLITDVVAIACCVLRWYILRKQRQTTGSLLSHFLFALAILCEIAATIQSSVILLEGDKVIAEKGIVAAQSFLLDERVLRVTFFAHLMYYLAECVLKAAYLAFYADLYARVQTNRRHAIWIATFIWVASYVSAILVLFTYCLPFEQNWKPDGTNPHCPVLFNVTAFFVLAGANILSDIAILIVPLLVISAMRLGRTEKVSLALVFSIGMISIAASVIRAGIVGDRFITANHTWDTVWVWMLWSHAEMFFGVIAFTLPSFRYILLRGINKAVASRSGNNSSSRRKYGSKLSSLKKWAGGDSTGADGVELGSTASTTGRGFDRDRKQAPAHIRDGGVLVETTVTLRAESPVPMDRDSEERIRREASESQTELTAGTNSDKRLEQARVQGSQGYEWKIDRSNSHRHSGIST